MEEVTGKQTYQIRTYGCWMNDHDSEAIAAGLEAAGYAPAHGGEADLLVFNTCCITKAIEMQAMADIAASGRRYAAAGQRAGRIVICGCMARQPDMEAELREKFAFAEICIAAGAADGATTATPHCNHSRTSQVTAYVTAITGCDNSCAYCVVPTVRGPARCRPATDIADEVSMLKDAGYKEITLLGQNICAYHDSHQDSGFIDLLKLTAATGIERIRFLTSNPQDITPALLELMANTPSIENHLHMPIQSGSDQVLSTMGRGYDQKRILQIASDFYRLMPDGCLTTDIMVGFLGETDADFEQTVEVYEACRFTSAYIFTYSKRPGTPAANRDDISAVPTSISLRRFNRMHEVKTRIQTKRMADFIGSVQHVLIEASDQARGRAANGLPIMIDAPLGSTAGFVDVMITGIENSILCGVRI